MSNIYNEVYDKYKEAEFEKTGMRDILTHIQTVASAGETTFPDLKFGQAHELQRMGFEVDKIKEGSNKDQWLVSWKRDKRARPRPGPPSIISDG